ncbi:FAD binding domain-containing protein [Jannaschia sp. LMIT008]|uniref:FAD binding domain-containing protein n=1 Tax=Jannaschia maritima TaxID=3032585 RepID=UPI00281156BB|nr:FAD binding domain-containing protein [Jannaschia sp. LMIT008]
MYDFDFANPATLDEAVAALGRGDAQALAGGQTYLPALRQRLAAPDTIVSLKRVEGLSDIEATVDTLRIGAMATHARIARETADRFPALSRLAGNIGDMAVRSRGTLGGSLANNDPSACYPAMALATGATIHTNARDIAAEDFFRGMFETALDDGEIITAVTVPVAQAAHYEKFVQRASRFALVGVFAARYPDGARVAVTGASSGGVFRWTEAEERLSDRFEASALDGLTIAPDDMIEDLHATKPYRAHLVSVMTRRAVEHA